MALMQDMSSPQWAERWST